MGLLHKIIKTIRWHQKSNPKYAERQGEKAEEKIARKIEKDELIINDLLFRCANGSTCQIDHIVITTGGIIVIETKSHEGRIYGSADQLYWTETFRNSNKTYKMYNPIKQNETHIKHLKEILGDQIPFYSAVVFTKADISYLNAPGIYTPKTMQKMINYISAQDWLTAEQTKYIYEYLRYIRNTNTVTKEEHIQRIQTNNLKRSGHYCPNCGAKLRYQKTQNSAIWSCPNFEFCQYYEYAL